MKSVYLGIGTNLGDREGNLTKAVELIKEHIGPVKGMSSVYETEPWGFESVNLFLNLTLRVETRLSLPRLLEKILMIESLMGRVRESKDYRSRIIDIDILFYDKKIIDKEGFVIPRPLLPERRFVLVPLCEIARDLIHPVMGKSIRELLEECPDKSKVVKIN